VLKLEKFATRERLFFVEFFGVNFWKNKLNSLLKPKTEGVRMELLYQLLSNGLVKEKLENSL
jgi:hypothetical protein